MTRQRTGWAALLLLAGGCAGPPGATSVYAPYPGGKTGTFPFRFAVALGREEEPVEGAQYSAWESR